MVDGALASDWAKWISWKAWEPCWKFRWCCILMAPLSTVMMGVYCVVTKTLLKTDEDWFLCGCTIAQSLAGTVTFVSTLLPGCSDALKSMLLDLKPLIRAQDTQDSKWKHVTENWSRGNLLRALQSFDPWFQQCDCITDKMVELAEWWRELDNPTGSKWEHVKQFVHCIISFLDIFLISYPVLMAARVFVYPDVPFAQQPSDLKWEIAVVLLGPLASYAIFRQVLIATLVPLCVSRVAVLRIIHDIRLPTGTEDVNWSERSLRVHLLDKKLERLWSIICAGAPWMCCLFTAACSCLSGVALFLESPRSIEGAGLFLFSALFLLFALASLSSVSTLSMCQSATALSIPAAARSYLACLSERDEKWKDEDNEIFEDESRWRNASNTANQKEQMQAHARFMSYIAENKMGVQIFGVLVTHELVTDLGAKVLGGVPALCAAYTLALKSLHDHRHDHREHTQ